MVRQNLPVTDDESRSKKVLPDLGRTYESHPRPLRNRSARVTTGCSFPQALSVMRWCRHSPTTSFASTRPTFAANFLFALANRSSPALHAPSSSPPSTGPVFATHAEAARSPYARAYFLFPPSARTAQKFRQSRGQSRTARSPLSSTLATEKTHRASFFPSRPPLVAPSAPFLVPDRRSVPAAPATPRRVSSAAKSAPARAAPSCPTARSSRRPRPNPIPGRAPLVRRSATTKLSCEQSPPTL